MTDTIMTSVVQFDEIIKPDSKERRKLTQSPTDDWAELWISFIQGTQPQKSIGPTNDLFNPSTRVKRALRIKTVTSRNEIWSS